MLLTAPPRFSLSTASSSPSSSSSSPSPCRSIRRRRSSGVNLRRRSKTCRASLLITNPDFFQVGRLIGSYGFMNVTSYSGLQLDKDVEYLPDDMGKLKTQDVGEGSVKIRLYEGRIAEGPFRGTPILFKVYPGQRAGGSEADIMAANELNAHSYLQSMSESSCENILVLLGGFETRTGEQWLAFRDAGKYSAADYAKFVSEKLSKNRAVDQQSWNPFENKLRISRRRRFVVKLLQGAIRGLAFMHENDRLHQSLGPSSVVLNTMVERDAAYLVPQLRDLAFSVDIRYSSLEEGPGPLSEGLWRRASAAGAFTPSEKSVFGKADDIFEAGFLLAYLAFVPLCEEVTVDSLSLQRLFESTFQLDIEAARDYCLADDRLLEAVEFLDCDNGAGWDLLQAMLNRDFQKRPTAQAVLNHRFFTDSTV